jgi:hypothetical protein
MSNFIIMLGDLEDFRECIVSMHKDDTIHDLSTLKIHSWFGEDDFLQDGFEPSGNDFGDDLINNITK